MNNKFQIPDAVAKADVTLPYMAFKYTGATDEVELADDPGDQVCGFSTNPAEEGQRVKLETAGFVYARIEGVVARDAELTASDTADKEGYLRAAVSAEKIVAYAAEVSTDGAVIKVQVAPRGQVKA